MKILLLISLFFYSTSYSQGQVKVSVSNFENDKGVCYTCVFNSENSFKEMKALQCSTTSITNKTSEVVFNALPDGEYAIFVFHDKNENGKMDKNFLGIPSEGYGASQNKLPFAAAPKFEANKFSVKKNVVVTARIRLRNI